MISWLQRTLERHYKWLFMGLLAVVIVAFVFTIGASPGIGGAQKKYKQKLYYGYDLNSQEVVEGLFTDANISFLLNTGRELGNSPMAQEQVLARPALMHLADVLQIPEPEEGGLIQYIKEKPMFRNEEGKFEVESYNRFLRNVEEHPELDQGRVREVLAQDYRMEQVVKAIGGPGYVYPYEAVLSVERLNTKWSVDVATIKADDFKSQDMFAEEELREYYVKNKFKYAMPERVRVSYVLFAKDDYMGKIGEPTEGELKEFYDTTPGLFMDAKGEAILPFEEVTDRVRKEYKPYKAGRLATEAANNFVYEVYDNNVEKGSEAFVELLDKNEVALRSMEAFSRGMYPEGTDMPRELLDEAFSLNEEHYYSNIAQVDRGAVILLYEELMPVSVPELEDVNERVKGDYVVVQKLKLLDTKGKVLEKTFAKAVREGKDFEKVARKEGLRVESYDEFKLTDPPKELDQTLLPDIQVLNEQEVSPFILNDKEGRFVFIRKKERPSVAKDDAEVTELLVQLEGFSASVTAQGFVREMVEKGMQR